MAVGPPPGAPPGVRWHTREDSGLRLDRELRWWHDGEPLDHPRIVEAFNRGLTVTPEGRHRLDFGGDWCFVEVEDCGFGVVAVDLGPQGQPVVRLSDRTAEPLDLGSLALDGAGALTCRVKGGRGKARFSRPAHAALALDLEPHGGRVVLKTPSGSLPTSLPVAALTGAC